MKTEEKMKVLILLSVISLCSSRHTSRDLDHKFITSFVVSPERKDGFEDRKSREIVEIIPEATTVSTLSHYPIDCTNQKECDAANVETTPMPTFRPYSQEELNSFLKKYVDEHGKKPENPSNKLANLYMEEPVNVLEGLKEKSKSWQLMQSQKHNHPYDDRTGWVTLEPVPWSASQIQKWEPNRRPPQIPQWEPEQKPNRWQDRPWNKPSYDYKPTQKPYDYNKPGWSDSYGSGSDIITDGRPTSFPHDYQSKPYYKPQEHKDGGYLPGDGDGRWVLLSSTKGYSLPQRNRAYQRALVVPTSGHQVKSHRSVKLTVLPPEDSANTAISHGGLIEVEKGSQTVEESQREHAAKMLKLTQPPPEVQAQKQQQQEEEKEEPQKQQQPVTAVKRSGTVRVYPVRVTHPRSNAMIAAVGAGMIPATMAMLLPMVLGRKRRSLDTADMYTTPYQPQAYFY